MGKQEILQDISNTLTDLGRGLNDDGCLNSIYKELSNLNKSVIIAAIISKYENITPQIIKKAVQIAESIVSLENGAPESVWTKEVSK